MVTGKHLPSQTIYNEGEKLLFRDEEVVVLEPGTQNSTRLRLDDIGIKCFSQSCFFVLSGCFCVKRGRETGVFVYRPPNTIIASLRKKKTTKLVPKLFFVNSTG